jgi:hypothetical protein
MRMRASPNLTLALLPLIALASSTIACGARSSELPTDLSRMESAPSCGDTAIVARFLSCKGQKDESGCTKAGGEWVTVGLALNKICVCPTGQGSCTCTRKTDCLGYCIGGAVGTQDCTGITSGKCSSIYPLAGCRCWFTEKGVPEAICAD